MHNKRILNLEIMTREYVYSLINQGYHVIENGIPRDVTGDIWYYLDIIDKEDSGVILLEDLLLLSDDELEKFNL